MSRNDVASRLQLPAGTWQSVLDGLCARFPAITREAWRQRFERGLVQHADGTPIAIDAPYRVGLEVQYFREVAMEVPVPFTEVVLHVDAHLVVVDKPHFLPVVPAGAYVRETLLGRLMRKLGNADLVPLHRIDRETAGLVMFSANPATRSRYQALFSERRIDKSYEAIAPALPAVHFPRVRKSRLDAGEPFFRMREVDGVANSETRIDVIERGGAHWRYALHPITGRKHQLRVHMASLGAPIVGDRMYPAVLDIAANDFSRPLQLLAKSLAFVDPVTGEARHFDSEHSLLGPA